ncbi:MAG: polysaccharide deacetylase family protein [Flavobacteriales bacterium]|nr:polysaccharide deacetylase family protein [Flavobacteriales bacterium]
MNYRSLNVIALLLVLILIPAVVQGFVGAWVFVPLALGYVTVLGWGVFDIGSQFFVRTIWKGEKGKVSLTFDDGPHPVHTPEILEVLKEEGVKAAFFCIGKKAEAHPELVRLIVAEGHVVGNHTYLHTHRFGMLPVEKVREEMQRGKAVLKNIIGRTPRMFRPPFGVTNPKIARAVAAENDVIIGWDLRSRDGVARSEQQILDRVMPRLDKATLLLFHDTNPHSPEAVRKVIHRLRERGKEIVSLEELTGISPYTD